MIGSGKGGLDMATNNELRSSQKALLFKLLMLKKEITNNKTLDIAIVEAKATMEAEDAAYVEKMIAELG